MPLLDRYDSWLHDRLFNPAFTWLQKWFHVNRFQIIYGFLACMYAAGVLVGLGFLARSPFDADRTIASFRLMLGVVALTVVGLMALTNQAKRTFQDLKAASKRYEETGQSRVSLFLYAKIVRSRGVRARRNAAVTGVSLFFLLNAAFQQIPDLRQADILFAGIFLIWGILAHVWDVHGVKPEDRVNLFEPQLDAA